MLSLFLGFIKHIFFTIVEEVVIGFVEMSL